MHMKLPPPHGDQLESQGSSKSSDMPPSTSIFPHEKLQVLIDKDSKLPF